MVKEEERDSLGVRSSLLHGTEQCKIHIFHKVVKARTQRCVLVALNSLLKHATNKISKFLVDSPAGANLPLAPVDACVNMSLALPA